MSSFEHCNVIISWDGSTKTYIPVASCYQALRITREKLSGGWTVSWSNALIDRMTRNKGPLNGKEI